MEPTKLHPINTRDEGAFGDLPMVQSTTHNTINPLSFAELGPTQADKKVFVRARLQYATVKGNLAFLVLRQNHYTIQATAFKSEQITKEMLNFIGGVSKESIVEVEGELKKVDKEIKKCSISQYEIQIHRFFVVNRSFNVLPFQLDDASRKLENKHDEYNDEAQEEKKEAKPEDKKEKKEGEKKEGEKKEEKKEKKEGDKKEGEKKQEEKKDGQKKEDEKKEHKKEGEEVKHTDDKKEHKEGEEKHEKKDKKEGEQKKEKKEKKEGEHKEGEQKKEKKEKKEGDHKEGEGKKEKKEGEEKKEKKEGEEKKEKKEKKEGEEKKEKKEKKEGEEKKDKKDKKKEAAVEEEPKMPVVKLKTRLNARVIDFRTPANQAIFRIQSAVCRYFRDFLYERDFIEIHTPKMLGGSSEGGANVFKFDYFGHPACLAQSPQLYKQMMVMGDFTRVFEIGPVFRAELSNTHRHLTEFTGLDIEMAINESYYEIMDIIGNLFTFIFKNLEEKCKTELKAVNDQYEFEPFLYTEKPLILKFEDGVKMLNEAGIKQPVDDDLTTETERELGKIVRDKYKTDFYILHRYPQTARPFYTMLCKDDPNFTCSYDVFMRGEEIISGAQRVHDPELLAERAVYKKIPVDTIRDYINSFKYGAYPHGGFGVGLERVVMLYLDLGNIRKASAFPRDPQRITP